MHWSIPIILKKKIGNLSQYLIISHKIWHDEITYPDKKACDFILRPTINIKVGLSNMQWKDVTGWKDYLITDAQKSEQGGANLYVLLGNVNINGMISLDMLESLSGEKMWTKNITLEPTTIDWKGEQKYTENQKKLTPNLLTDLSFGEALGKALDAYYNLSMEKVYTYLNPEEMRALKKQADELKAKKVY